MIGSREIVIVSLLGLLTTSSILGAALGLYVPLSKRMLACVLAFAAGALISALAIELAFEGAQDLHQQGFDANAAWAFIGSGFALGSIIYYFTSLFLDQKRGGDTLPDTISRICSGTQAEGREGDDPTAVEM
jgi:zinc transporter ZupT